MSIYRRDAVWWVYITSPSGKRIRKTTGTADEKAAQEYHDRLKAELWRTSKLGDKPKYTFDQAALRWLKEAAEDGKKTIAQDKVYIRYIREFIGRKYLDEIVRDEIQDAIAKLEHKPATRNRYLATIRAIFRRAALDWGWIDRPPTFKLAKVSNARVRWLTVEQVNTLLAELPDHQKATVQFALATGLRKANVLGLKWENVSLVQRTCWVNGEDFKNGDDHGIALNDTAVEVIRAQIGKHQEYVFTYRGKPIIQANTKAWRAALVRAGITNFRWHDLRHVAASWLAQQGTPPNILQEIFGWKSPAMAKRYSHFSTEHLAEHMKKLDCTFAPQSKKKG